jgi:hypothetical protein
LIVSRGRNFKQTLFVITRCRIFPPALHAVSIAIGPFSWLKCETVSYFERCVSAPVLKPNRRCHRKISACKTASWRSSRMTGNDSPCRSSSLRSAAQILMCDYDMARVDLRAASANPVQSGPAWTAPRGPRRHAGRDPRPDDRGAGSAGQFIDYPVLMWRV